MTRLAFPFAIAATGRSASLDYGSDAHVRQMLELLILTVCGERVMRPDLGSPVSQMLFRAGEGPAAAALGATLHATVTQWLGHLLEVRDLTVNFLEGEAVLEIVIVYHTLTDATKRSHAVRTAAA
jgi:phage baseplate assembly protein W